MKIEIPSEIIKESISYQAADGEWHLSNYAQERVSRYLNELQNYIGKNVFPQKTTDEEDLD